jgi:MoaA/NifB/PqqE/SkfB family radical SAM enzyme
MIMTNPAENLKVIKAILSNPQIIRAKPSINVFFCHYLRKFKVKDIGGNLFLHSHLPPLNSKAYSRFIKEHLLVKAAGPSHAQIGITNACPQNCEYCYNKGRTGRVMDKNTIKATIRDLKDIGVFWIGITGGEPLLNKNIAEIVEAVGNDCSSKLFTTGCTLTKQRALDLKNAGLISVSVSLDHWHEAEHDKIRRYKGAFRAALDAIEIFKSTGGMHVSVSAVLSKGMLKQDVVEKYLDFIEGLGIHEAWLSETKPSVFAHWKNEFVITEQEHAMLLQLQDRYNKQDRVTVNYLGHFENAQYFGCSAGHKMVYVDAFGEVCPCVFIPMTFGNVQERSIKEIYGEMRKRFPTENCCFINKNFEKLQRSTDSQLPLGKKESLKMMEEIEFGPLPKFFQLQYR